MPALRKTPSQARLLLFDLRPLDAGSAGSGSDNLRTSSENDIPACRFASPFLPAFIPSETTEPIDYRLSLCEYLRTRSHDSLEHSAEKGQPFCVARLPRN